MTSPYAIALEGVHKRFGGPKGNQVLDGLDLFVSPGHVHGLLGPNGAGKTTAVRIMTTLLQADSGSVRIAGYEAQRRPKQVRQHIGLVGQHAAVDEELTGAQNLELFARLNRYTARSASVRADELLEQFGLTDAAGQRVKTYSGGMRRRVDLAAGLITAPQVLFVDEPTTGLDPAVRHDVWDAINSMAQSGTTVLLTTQYLEEADRLADCISMLGRGKVVEEGAPAQLKARIGDDWLEVTPAAATPPSSYRQVLSAWSSAAITEESGVLRVPLADRANSLLGAAAALRTAGLEVADLTVRAPTLDEVFLEVSGHSALAEEEHSTTPTTTGSRT